jgi:hypothetical protein
MGVLGIFAVVLYLILVAFLVVHGLIAMWPPNTANQEGQQSQTQISPPGAPTQPAIQPGTSEKEPVRLTTQARQCRALGQEPVRSYVGREFCLSEEERLLFIVLLAGALGGLVHAFRSLYWYTGNRKMVWSWAVMYVILPFLGSTMALVFYLVIRGGFFSPTADVQDTSSFGFAALAVLVGMFTNEAAQKLKEVAETVLSKAERGKDHVTAKPVVTDISLKEGSTRGGDNVTISGAGFVQETIVKFGTSPARTSVDLEKMTITAVAPPHAAGKVDITVMNPGGQSTVVSGAFTYVEPSPPAASTPNPPGGTQ